MGKESGILLEATKSLFMRDLNELDSNVPPILWRDDLYLGSVKKTLRVGWFDEDEVFCATPGVKRAIAIAVQVIKVSCSQKASF